MKCCLPDAVCIAAGFVAGCQVLPSHPGSDEPVARTTSNVRDIREPGPAGRLAGVDPWRIAWTLEGLAPSSGDLRVEQEGHDLTIRGTPALREKALRMIETWRKK